MSSDFLRFGECSNSCQKKKKTDEQKFVSDSVRDAKSFISNLEFRELTITKAVCAIVKAQIEFFKRGPRYLVPLRERDIAQAIGVHEATISRMANSKYLQCEWGLFAVRFFFTNAVTHIKPAGFSGAEEKDISPVPSKESVKYEIAQILSESAKSEKHLSDQKISQLLENRGIKIARRTVAKYRHELNIGSSYLRT